MRGNRRVIFEKVNGLGLFNSSETALLALIFFAENQPQIALAVIGSQSHEPTSDACVNCAHEWRSTIQIARSPQRITARVTTIQRALIENSIA
jgi:hypothetical protein